MEVVIKNLVKKYDGHKAVDDISFQVKKGEVLGFLGPNGAGKSTTMKIITCYLAPSEGDVEVGGYSILKDPEKVKQLIGYLPENNPLYLDMPVMEYLEFSALLQGVPKDKVKGRIKEMIQVCGLVGEKHKKIEELSKGYRQRVGLAQAMIHDPQVLILDEPTTGLDPNQIVEIRKLIRELGKEKAVILSTHILPEVEAICDRVVIIDKGKIVANDTATNLKTQSKGQVEISLKIEDADPTAVETALKALPFVINVQSKGSNEYVVITEKMGTPERDVFKMCVEKGWVLTKLTPSFVHLEEIFHELTTK